MDQIPKTSDQSRQGYVPWVGPWPGYPRFRDEMIARDFHLIANVNTAILNRLIGFTRERDSDSKSPQAARRR